MLDLPDEKDINAQTADAKRSRDRCESGSRQWRQRTREIRRLYRRRNHKRGDATRHIAKQVAATAGVEAAGAEITNTVAMTASAAGTVTHPGTNVAQKRALNRSLADRRFGGVRTAAERACAKAGTLYVGVAAAGTSQICHRCGTLGQHETQTLFRCAEPQGCGWETNADHNSANTAKHRTWSAFCVDQQTRRPGGSSLDGGTQKGTLGSANPLQRYHHHHPRIRPTGSPPVTHVYNSQNEHSRCQNEPYRSNCFGPVRRAAPRGVRGHSLGLYQHKSSTRRTHSSSEIGRGVDGFSSVRASPAPIWCS